MKMRKTSLSTQVQIMAWIFMAELILTRCVIKMERFLTLDLTMGGIAGGGEKQDKENGVLIIRNSFPQLVDVDNLQAVHFGNIDQWLEVRE